MENGIDLENDLVAFLKDIVKNDHDYISEIITESHSIFSLNGNRNGDEEDYTFLEDDYN